MQIPLLALKEYYWQKWTKLKELSLHSNTHDLLFQLTALIDKIIIDIVKSCQINLEKITVIALGGYARKQFFPYSDIDLLILYRDKLDENEINFIKKITTTIWDLNITLSIQLKNIDEIIDFSKQDEIFKTALLDNRFIIGNKELYNECVLILEKNIFGRNKYDYLISKVKNVRDRDRTKKISNSIYLLEPNLKETPGGLRDINTIYWICKLLFNSTNLSIFLFKNILTEKDLLILSESIEFIFKIRIHLHYFHKRKYDILNMEAQKYLARTFGYLDTSISLGVEIFMKDYYKAANVVQEKVNKIINLSLKGIFKTNEADAMTCLGFGFYRYKRFITFKDYNFFAKRPENIIFIFSLAANKNLKISDRAKDIIKENLSLIDDRYIKKYGVLFLKTISNFPYSSEIIKNMIETKVLQKFIPEFEEILCRPQFDYYHHYTVDEHTILALKNIDTLIMVNDSKKLPFINAFRELKRKELLALSILLHDIGKGYGKNHSLIGSKIAEKVCYRLGINEETTKIIIKMVAHHLLMNHIAQRRDIKDLDVLKYFNKYIDNVEELNTLFLLTYADINAVGGFNYSNWVNALIVEFYENAKKAISNKNIVFNKEFIVKNKLNDLLKYFNNDIKIQQLLHSMDKEYIYSNNIKTIKSHLNLLTDVSTNNAIKILIKVKSDINCLDVTICTYDYIGLLRDIAAAFLSFNFNILNAEVNTLSNGMTVDTFLVSKNDVSIEEVTPSIQYIQETLKDLIAGNINPYILLKEKLVERFEKKRITDVKSTVEFDNKLSENYTIIDIYTIDKVGLLFKLLDQFCKLNISVQKAKISTDVDRVVDSFYVTNEKGGKIINETQIKSIKKILEDTINE